MLHTAVCVLALLAADPFRSALWPEYLGDWKRVSAAPIEVPETTLPGEYGLQAAERAEYAIVSHRMGATAYRFRDAIAGYAGYLALRPPEAKKSDFDTEAARAGDSTFVLYGNYVFRFDGGLPDYFVYEQLLAFVPKLDQTALSQLKDALPKGFDANSERYLLGPDSLAKFLPRVPPSVAAFRLGAQGIVARYGQDTLGIFEYPNAATATARASEFGKLPGAAVKGFGRYVAVIFEPDARGQSALAAAKAPAPPAPSVQPPAPGGAYFSAGAVGMLLLAGAALGLWLRRRPAVTADAAEEIRLKLEG